MDELEIITTSDGSHTLRNKKLNETYHSVHGAVQESMHVFIKNGLEYFRETHQSNHLSVLEIGFGTGLNALLSFQYALSNKMNIRYTTLEPFPLPEQVWSQLNYADGNKEHFNLIHKALWEDEALLTPEFALIKKKTTVQNVTLAESYGVIFFDAFAPSIQPELWAYEILARLVSLMKPGGVFVTYSARGQLKRDLKTLGLMVETLPGPPGKNEMVRGTKAKVLRNDFQGAAN